MSGVDVAILAAFLEVSPATLRQSIRRHGIRPVRPGCYDPREVSRHRRHAHDGCLACRRPLAVTSNRSDRTS